MSALTLDQLRDRLALYVAAEAKILAGAQSYRVGDRTFQRGELDVVRDEIRRISGEIARASAAASGTRGRLRYGMPG